MRSGGVADKLGNRYEAKWLVQQLLRVIAGDAESLRYEGIPADFDGFEFSVRSAGVTSWHQTKINAPSNTWTVAALSREGVLSAFKGRLAASPSDRCVLVSQYLARDLRELSGKAHDPLNLGEFKASLNTDEALCFGQLCTAWAEPEERAWSWLRRCSFEPWPETAIDTINATIGDLYFENGRANAFPLLRDYLETRFNRVLTTEIVRGEIRAERQLIIKEPSLDPTVAERVQQATRAYLETYSPFGFGGTTVARRETAALIDKVLRPNGPLVTLVIGVAGSGKSGVVRGFLENLAEQHIPHFAMRIDQNLDCTTLEQVCQNRLQRAESPEILLKRIAGSRRGVLVIDQLDAVSEVSGRNSAVKNAVLDIVERLPALHTIQLVLVCRAFDLASDRRLKQLKSQATVETVEVGLLDWDADVVPLLNSKGIAPASRSLQERKLLALPLNLMLFIECADPRPFTSPNDLFARLLEYKERQLNEIKSLSWAPITPLSVLAQWMSDKQRLTAPESVLDTIQRDLLAHAGMIVHVNRQLSFFHESFFDFCYAWGFANTGKTLLTLLRESEQHLFRRTQVRQILETLRQDDRPRYLIELDSILNAADVRYHIKDAVGQWLGSLPDTSAEECALVLRLDRADKPFVPFVRNAMLGGAAWFDRLHQLGWVAATLESSEPSHINAMFWWMSELAGTRGATIATTLTAWWRRDPSRAERLLDWFGFSRRHGTDPALLTLCEDLIRSKPAQLFQGQSGTKASTVLGNWTEGNAAGSGTILKALFDVWFDTHPGEHPFDRDELNAMDQHHLHEVAEKAPSEFLHGTIDALLRALDIAQSAAGSSSYLNDFSWRTREQHRIGADAFVALFALALKKLAMQAPDATMQFLQRMDPRRHVTLLHLHLETIAGAATPVIAKQLPTLLDCTALFDAGWQDAEWKSFADAAHAASPHLNDDERRRIETAILEYTPELRTCIEQAHRFKHEDAEKRAHTRRWVRELLADSGRTQWLILQTIGGSRLTLAAQARLDQLNRKFGTSLPPLRDPSGIISHVSPIGEEQANRMSDAQWLHAMEKYAARVRQHWPYQATSAAEDLVLVLRQAVSKEPARFIALLEPIVATTHKSYVSTILSSAAEANNLADGVVATAVRMAHAYPGRPFGMEISRIVGRNPSSARIPEVFETLIWYVVEGSGRDPEIKFSDREKELNDINDLLRKGHELHSRGINTVRGHAAEDLATVLWAVPELRESAWALVEGRSRNESSLSIRFCLVRCLLPLHNLDHGRAANILVQLATPPKNAADAPEWLAPAAFQYGFQLLRHTLYTVPNVGRVIVRRFLDSGDAVLRGIGVWHWCVESFRDAALQSEAEAFVSESTLHRRLAASIAADFAANEAQNEQARRWLLRAFDDDDRIVRRHATEVFRSISPNDVYHHLDIVEAYMDSPAYDDEAHSFFHLLNEATCDVCSLVVEASERLVDRIKRLGPTGQGRHTDLHQLQDLLKRDYAVTESTPALRKRFLDLIDQMLALELYGIQNVLKEHDRL